MRVMFVCQCFIYHLLSFLSTFFPMFFLVATLNLSGFRQQESISFAQWVCVISVPFMWNSSAELDDHHETAQSMDGVAVSCEPVGLWAAGLGSSPGSPLHEAGLPSDSGWKGQPVCSA